MNDNEIIKALECCKTLNCVKCGRIKDFKNASACLEKMIADSLDLINRQKAEIERLQKKANTPFAKVTFDRDKLQEMVDECAKNIEIDINLAKSEAIKEFVERLKHFIIPQKADGYTREIVLKRDIDNLVKEMTEANEDE